VWEHSEADNPALYEQQVHWQRGYNRWFYEKKRLFQRLIGPEVESILDVGCGDGAITNDLCPDRLVVGCDRSAAALAYVSVPKVQASCRELPFQDRSFDLVLASELLEHLPDAVYLRAVNELTRVARRHVVISVPYREQLAARTTKCRSCGLEYHIDGHLRAFGAPSDVAVRFRGFRLGFVGFCGETYGRAPKWMIVLCRRLARHWPRDPIAICPRCQGKEVAGPRRLNRTLRRVLDGLQRRLSSKPLHMWMVLGLDRVWGAA